MKIISFRYFSYYIVYEGKEMFKLWNNIFKASIYI